MDGLDKNKRHIREEVPLGNIICRRFLLLFCYNGILILMGADLA